jgi:hypothetical protein
MVLLDEAQALLDGGEGAEDAASHLTASSGLVAGPV